MVPQFEDCCTDMPSPDPNSAYRSPQRRVDPFFGLIGSVIVEEGQPFAFDGAIPQAQAAAVWSWVVRDLAPDLLERGLAEGWSGPAEALEARMPALIEAIRAEMSKAVADPEADRKLAIRIGDADAMRRLPHVVTALKVRGLLGKAQDFGRAVNTISDDADLAEALAVIPLADQAIAGLLFQAMMRQVQQPHRLVLAASKRAGSAMDTALIRGGFGPMVSAMLASAQNEIPVFSTSGAFADMDLICRSIDRYHRMVRAVGSYIDLGRLNSWTTAIAALTKRASEQLEPRLREVAPDMTQALRQARDGADRVDADRLLTALNGTYLLVTLRNCRDSLALNALIDEVWQRTGQILEAYVPRNLELVRLDPGNAIARQRLDSGLKMAELRFGPEYAEVIRRARDGEVRRQVS